MAYTGDTYVWEASKVGFNGNPNETSIAPEAMVDFKLSDDTPYSSRNINILNNGLQSRRRYYGYTLPEIGGFQTLYGHQFIDSQENSYDVLGTSLGKIVLIGSFPGSPKIKTGLTINKTYNFSRLSNRLYVCNGADIPQVLNNGDFVTGFTNLALKPTDWSGALQPQYMITHGRGNAQSLWAFGVPTKPFTVYVSKLDNGSSEADFSDAQVLLLYIATGDNYGIIGGVEFGERAIFFGKKKAYIINDDDPDRTKWFSKAASWEGRAISHSCIVKIPNDVVIMAPDGDIYSITAVQSYGDYKSASIAAPSFIQAWIKDNVDLTQSSKFHGKYDVYLRAVRFYIVTKGSSYADKILLYSIDKTPDKAWSIHDVSGVSNGVSDVWVHNDVLGEYLLAGDYLGHAWYTDWREETTSGVTATFTTPLLDMGNPRQSKMFDSLRVVGKYDSSLTCTAWIDGSETVAGTFTIPVTGIVMDEGLAALGLVGKRIRFHFSGQDFTISRLLIDFRPLGSQE